MRSQPGGYRFVMALSRTYLNVHWITDDAGGLLLGSGLALLVWGALAGRIRAEVDAARVDSRYRS